MYENPHLVFSACVCVYVCGGGGVRGCGRMCALVCACVCVRGCGRMRAHVRACVCACACLCVM